MNPAPIGDPTSDSNNVQIAKASDRFYSELRDAADHCLFGSVYARVVFQGGCVNKIDVLPWPIKVH